MFFGIQVLSGTQLTVYLSFLIPIYIITRLYFTNSLFDKKTLNKLAYLLGAGFVSFIISGFFVIQRLAITPAIRSIQENTRSYWRLNSINSLVLPDSNLSLGLVPLLFLLIGGYLVLIKKKKEYYPFLILFLVSLLLIFGPTSEYTLYYWFYKLWPFVDKFRTPYRLFPFLIMSSCMINAAMYVFIKEKLRFKKEYLLFIALMLLIILTYKIFSKYLTEYFITYL